MFCNRARLQPGRKYCKYITGLQPLRNFPCQKSRFSPFSAYCVVRHPPPYPSSTSKRPQLKRFLDTTSGVLLGNVWTDILPINSQAQERLGYPTQKPEALLERILKASSNEGDLVLDPFCGCGTTVQAAQRLNRRWIGIDITHLAIGLIKQRLSDSYGPEVKQTYEVIGEPTDYAGAAALAAEDKYQFQWWALGQVGARPVDQRKGADRGIDGRLYFHDDESGQSKQIIFSVKAGGRVPRIWLSENEWVPRVPRTWGPGIEQPATRRFCPRSTGQPR
jgi:hypothetical protein